MEIIKIIVRCLHFRIPAIAVVTCLVLTACGGGGGGGAIISSQESSSAAVSSSARSSSIQSSIVSSSSAESSVSSLPQNRVILTATNAVTTPSGEFQLDPNQQQEVFVLPDVGFDGRNVQVSNGCNVEWGPRSFFLKHHNTTQVCTVNVEATCADYNNDGVCDIVGKSLVVFRQVISPSVVRYSKLEQTEFKATLNLMGDFDDVWLEVWLGKSNPESHSPILIPLIKESNFAHTYTATFKFTKADIKRISSFNKRLGFIDNIYVRAKKGDQMLFPTNSFGGNTFPQIVFMDDTIPNATLKTIGSGVGGINSIAHNEYMVHMEDPHYYHLVDHQHLVPQLLKYFKEPNFIILSTMGPALPRDWSDAINVVSNIEGIGRDLFNARSMYGAKNELLSIIEMGQSFRDFFPFLHELGHYWGFYLNKAELRLADKICGCHRDFSATENGNLGFNDNILVQQLDGSFMPGIPVKEKSYKYDSLERYLMGAIPANEMTPLFMLKPSVDFLTYPFESADMEVLDANRIVSVYGARNPTAAQSPKKFSALFVLVSPQALTEDEISFFTFMAKYQGENHPIEKEDGRLLTKPTFSNAMDGLMTLTTKVETLQ